MDGRDIFLVIGILVASICIVGSVISTFLMWCDYMKKLKKFNEEVEHYKKELKTCRQLLQKQSMRDG